MLELVNDAAYRDRQVGLQVRIEDEPPGPLDEPLARRYRDFLDPAPLPPEADAEAADGFGGAFMAWFDNEEIWAQHVNSSGDAQWPTNGILINDSSLDSQHTLRGVGSGLGSRASCRRTCSR